MSGRRVRMSRDRVGYIASVSETVSAIVTAGKAGGTAPALYIGVAGDAPLTPSMRVSLVGVDRVELGRGDTRGSVTSTAAGAHTLAMTLADARLSHRHARMSRMGTAWVIEDLGSKNGTWVAGERITRRVLADGEGIVVGHTALVYRETGGEAGSAAAAATELAGLSTLSPALAQRFAELARAAASAVPIELTGESGTGKELVARAVHELSQRAGAFVAVNCGALPPTLIEAELFGHRRGAFTGASADRPGFIRSADGGTLFLDEIAELPAAAQAALLRVLQEHEVVPIGADRPVSVDLRVITASHKRLDAEVEAGRFRADLRARLLGAGIELPPLRERREDLGAIVATLLARLAPGRAVTFAGDAVAALYAYAWPLNIREVERALAAALAMASDRIELRHLPGGLQAPTRAAAPVAIDPGLSDDELRVVLTASIERHDGNLAAVARELGKDRTQIRRWMKRLGMARDGNAE